MSTDRAQTIRAALHHELQRLSADREPLDLIEDIPTLESFVDDYAEARIADARSAGASWATIAARLGVSRQAVHKRFGATRRRRGRRAVIELRSQRSDD